MDNYVRQAPVDSMKNRKHLTGMCSCYHCLAEFNISEISEWTDGHQTAICPKCNVDAVLPICDIEMLKRIQEHWF